MAKGISLHIGLNYVDTGHYDGWDGKLNACENDARDMQNLAKLKGFQSSLLLRADANRSNVIASIKNASANLVTGDFFLISYSGHGGQLPDMNGDESDGLDETWCLYDGQLIDDELFTLWQGFKEDVRILIVSDSCHSGTVAKFLSTIEFKYSEQLPKYMPAEIAMNTYMINKEIYDPIISSIKDVKSSDIKANVRLLSGCQDNQSSYDGPFNGAFTQKLKIVWNGGKFNENYQQFHQSILKLMPPFQSTNHLMFGKPNVVYDNQVPFTI